MDKINQKDPALVNQVTELIQSGLNPQQIANHLMEQSRRQAQGIEEEPEIFSDEVQISAQALAFRPATLDDCGTISRIINDAYQGEIIGAEAFREGPTVTESVINEMLQIETYRWTVVEAPCGRGIEEDGTILGVCCYTTDGVSRRNGEEEGKVGSVRYMAVVPRYKGVLVGHRLLLRVESQMALEGCVRIMISIPEKRDSMIQWAVNRDFVDVKTIPYPAEAIGQTMTCDTTLVIFQKPLKKPTASAKTTSLPVDTVADGKIASAVADSAAEYQDVSEGVESTTSVMPPAPPTGKVALPPHWRAGATTTTTDSSGTTH